ncbi:MAG: MBL fold metallo-hydrolase, partial [Pontibacterium sp.]
FNMLEHWNGGVDRRAIPIEKGAHFSVSKIPEIKIYGIPLLSNAPPYSPRRHNPQPGDNIGVFIEDSRTGKSVFYAPGLGEIEPHLKPWIEKADCLLVDGTLWTEDEMVTAVVGTRLGSQMGHLPQSGEGGMIEYLDTLDVSRKVLIHINNTNPILIDDGPERQILTDHGIEVAYDGMSIEL